MEIGNIIPHIEALIFASDKPLTSLEITELINNAFGFMEDKITLDQVESSMEGIIEKYSSDFYPFEVRVSGGGWQFLTKKDFHKTIAQLNGDKFLKRLSAASLETLAIIAYKQPITKGEIEAIRGVSSDYSIQKLLEKELILITGRNEELPGKPLVYATSKNFMDYFGINSADDLPKIREILANQVVEPTVVNPEVPMEQEEPQSNDDATVSLVVRGNGELIEEPVVALNNEPEAEDPQELISDEGQQIEEINEEVEHKMKEDLEKSDEARKKETPETEHDPESGEER
jgi:segregation and condensation protein B